MFLWSRIVRFCIFWSCIFRPCPPPLIVYRALPLD